MLRDQSLVRKTRSLLIHRPRTLTYTEIATKTGLTKRFIEQLALCSNNDYGANRVQILYEFLSNQKLLQDA